MLKWLQAILKDHPLPEELRASLNEKSVIRALEIQQGVIESLDASPRKTVQTGRLAAPDGAIDLIDPHWYQFDFDPSIDSPYWVMTSLDAPGGEYNITVSIIENEGGDKSIARAGMVLDGESADGVERERQGVVDLECGNIMLIAAAELSGRKWRIGGKLNRSLLNVDFRSRRQFEQDRDKAVEVLKKAGINLGPATHGRPREFARPLSDHDIHRINSLIKRSGIPAHISCHTTQTFGLITESVREQPYAPFPSRDEPWCFVLDIPSDGVVLALKRDGKIVGYEIDFVLGLKEAFERQKELLERSMGNLFNSSDNNA